MRTLFKTCVVAILNAEARLVIRKYKPHIVAVTGSVGKTSTKDAIFAVLARSEHVRKSEKSFNSEIGMPLTVLGCPNAWSNPLRWMQNIFDGLYLIVFPAKYPQWLVLEVGADRPGDISNLAKWLPVDVAVITRLPDVPVHVEFFDSPAAVVEEKASIIGAIKEGGALVLYGDDGHTKDLSARAEARNVRVITFGLTDGADVRGLDFALLREEGKDDGALGMSYQIDLEGTRVPARVLGVVGEHAALSSIAAAAVGRALGKEIPDILEGLEDYEPPHGRMHLIRGIKDTLIIDDTYNASPAAVAAGLDTLAFIAPTGRKIAALADMLELGRVSVDAHRKVGAQAAKAVDLLVTVGFRARDIASGALDNGLADEQIFQYEDSDRAGDELAAMLRPGDCVLVKGSQSMRMERVVEHLMAEPERAGELLVRQDEQWKKR